MNQTDCADNGSSVIPELLDFITAIFAMPFIIAMLVLIGAGYIWDRLIRQSVGEAFGREDW